MFLTVRTDENFAIIKRRKNENAIKDNIKIEKEKILSWENSDSKKQKKRKML